MHALVPSPASGTVRETYFTNQLRASGHAVSIPSQGDFLIDGKYLFEVEKVKVVITIPVDSQSGFMILQSGDASVPTEEAAACPR